MKNDYINQIAAEAQKKFEKAKDLILQEMLVAMNKAESEGDDAGSAVAEFIDMLYGVEKPNEECECDTCKYKDVSCDCAFNIVEDENIAWINEDLIDFEKDYHEIGVLIQKDDNNEFKIALEYDGDMDECEIPVLLSKAIVEAVYGIAGIDDVFDKEEIGKEIGDALAKAIVNLACNKIKSLLED